MIRWFRYRCALKRFDRRKDDWRWWYRLMNQRGRTWGQTDNSPRYKPRPVRAVPTPAVYLRAGERVMMESSR